MTKIGTVNANNLMAEAISSGITDPVKLANFMGQMQVESAGFTRMVEKTNYSAQNLVTLYPSKYTLTQAQSIVSQGQQYTMNTIYGNRSDLGNRGFASGDGWNYRKIGVR